jgi:hypothetical protein
MSYHPKEQLPKKRDRASKNIMLVLSDGSEVEGWYDSTGKYYPLGTRRDNVGRELSVVGWKDIELIPADNPKK